MMVYWWYSCTPSFFLYLLIIPNKVGSLTKACLVALNSLSGFSEFSHLKNLLIGGHLPREKAVCGIAYFSLQDLRYYDIWICICFLQRDRNWLEFCFTVQQTECETEVWLSLCRLFRTGKFIYWNKCFEYLQFCSKHVDKTLAGDQNSVYNWNTLVVLNISFLIIE